MDWTPADWEQILWTDESKFKMFSSKHRMCTIELENVSKYDCLTPSVKHRGGNVMVWGSVCSKGAGDLIKIDRIVNQKKYHSILVRHALPSGKKLIGWGFHFNFQDNDPKHTSKLCKNYLSQKNHLVT